MNKNRGGRPKIFNDDILKNILIDRESGMSYKALSLKYGTIKSTIYNYVKNAQKPVIIQDNTNDNDKIIEIITIISSLKFPRSEHFTSTQTSKPFTSPFVAV